MTKQFDEEIQPWALAVLAVVYSLVYAGLIPGLDDCLLVIKSGTIPFQDLCLKFKQLFSPQLQPGICSEAGQSWLQRHRGQKVAVLIAQCPQREVTFQANGGCPTNLWLAELLDAV